jgi:hypothetical protein
MKPTTKILVNRSIRRDDRPRLQTSRRFPLVDFAYQSEASMLSSSRSMPDRAALRAFRNLSREFLGRETSRNYVKETILFGVIVAVTAWPIGSMIAALVELVK